MNRQLISFLNVVLAISVIVSSCKKDEECSAIITITDELNNRIPGASVRLYYTDTNSNGMAGTIDETQLTNASGEAQFSFTLQAILFIYASKDSSSGNGSVILSSSETVKETVIIK